MDFYDTTAQVIPVLLLALIWESGYLNRLETEDRKNFRFWTKPRVRVWALFMSFAAIAGEVTVVLVLAEVVSPGDIPIALGLLGIAVLVGSLGTRLVADILKATAQP
jgi:hypothetical protein